MTATPSAPGGLRALPLRWRLSMITAAITLLALLIASASVLALVRTSLVHQIDNQLHSAALELQSRPGELGGRPMGPSDYHLRYLNADGSTIGDVDATTSDGDEPELPAMTQDEVDALDRDGYFTVTSHSGDGPLWRVYAKTATIEFPDGSTVDGSVMLALPLTSVSETTEEMIKIMSLVGLAVVLVGALAGYYAVQRSLRPLRDIEKAAGAVAAGDLSQRAPVQPPSTEVGRLGLSFNTMVAELEESFAERQASEARMRRFVSDASHELRTPLASIRGYGELYRMGAVPDEDVPATMGRIESEATRMGGLVNDLLALARLDEGRGLRLTEVDLVAVASDGVADLGALDPTRQARVLADGPVRVRADGDRIRQVVTNLVGNTVQHTPAGTAVEIAVHTEGVDEATPRSGWAVLEVVDHGPGIADTDSARVFERFYRPDTSRTRASGGSGLGLAIVATIIAAHGGSVRHQPTPGGGATIVVRLPIAGPVPAPEPPVVV